MEEVSGGRMHYMFNRVGGLKEDLPGRLARPGRRRPSPTVRRRLPDLERPDRRQRDLPGPHPRRRRAVRRRPVDAYGVSGPIARASGVDFDLRRDEPYLAYGELFGRRRSWPGRDPRPPATAWPGSRCCSSRCTSASTSPRPASTGCGSLPPGPVNVRLPKVLKVPEGDDVRLDREPARHQRLLPRLARREDPVAAQAALGVVQQHRRCSREVLPGSLVADMVAILGSMFFVVGDVDK